MCCSSASRWQILEEDQGLAQRPAADLVDRESFEPHGRGVVAQPASHAAGTGHLVDHPLKLVAINERNAPGFLKGREQPLVLEGKRASADVSLGELLGARSRPAAYQVYHESAAPWRIVRRPAAIETVERGIEVDTLGCGSASIIRAKSGTRREIRPDGDGALAQAQSSVGHQHCRVGTLLHAQPLADRAPAQRTVERKMMRRQLVKAAAAAIAHAMLAEALDNPARLARFVSHPGDVNDSFAEVERRLDRVRQPRPRRAAHHRAVNHDFDLVLAAMAQLGRIVQADRLAVDPHPCKARSPQGRPTAPRTALRRAVPRAP